jgi:peptide/nickel transport system permease protein
MLVLVSILVFSLSALAPGDPARKILATGGPSDQLDERDVAAERQELGLDRPLWEQYLRWSGDAVRGNLGRSYVNKQRVAALVGERIPASATLAACALSLSVALSLLLGNIAALRPRSAADSAIRLLTLLGASFPAFWLALLMIWLFAAQLHWLPSLGTFTPLGIVLPASVLALRTTGLLTRLVRATVLDAAVMDHVRVARAKGLSELQTHMRHVVPNALPPVLTVIGLDFAALVANAAVVEWVFAWPGLGRLGVEAALAGDVPVVMGFVLVAALTVVGANLLVDIGYGVLDPQQRAGAG